MIIAHRGLPKQYQENTYDSIINAVLHSNADGFELDIYKTKDDKLVAFHDDNTAVTLFLLSLHELVENLFLFVCFCATP